MTNSLIRGCDISVIQGNNIDFKALKASGIEFVICRAYVGNNGLDINYAKNVANAQAAGLYVGCYNFPFPLPYKLDTDTRSPKWQAQTHFKASNIANDLVFSADLEWPVQADWAKWGVSANSINDWLFAYLEEHTSLLGKPPLVYSYPDFMRTLGNPSGYSAYPLWIASYAKTPTIPKPWTDFQMWQFSGGTDHLPNGTPVDMDYIKDFSLWGVSSTPAIPSNSIPDISTTPLPAAPPPPAVVAPTPLPAPTMPIPSPVPTFNVSAIPGIVQNIYNWFKKN